MHLKQIGKFLIIFKCLVDITYLTVNNNVLLPQCIAWIRAKEGARWQEK